MADDTRNIQAIIQAGQQIANTLAGMRQMKWQRAIAKAKMDREERLIAAQQDAKKEAADLKFTREQGLMQEEIRKQREGSLAKLVGSLKLSDTQKQQQLEEGKFTGKAEKRVTKHTTTGTGRPLSARDALFYEMRADPVKFHKKMEKLKVDAPQAYDAYQKAMRSVSMWDMIMGTMGGQETKEPLPPGF